MHRVYSSRLLPAQCNAHFFIVIVTCKVNKPFGIWYLVLTFFAFRLKLFKHVRYARQLFANLFNAQFIVVHLFLHIYIFLFVIVIVFGLVYFAKIACLLQLRLKLKLRTIKSAAAIIRHNLIITSVKFYKLEIEAWHPKDDAKHAKGVDARIPCKQVKL